MVEKIKKKALEKGIPLSRLERRCQLSSGSIYRWDVNYPAVDKVKRVATALEITVDELIEEEEYDFI